jgi:hypothetical protein
LIVAAAVSLWASVTVMGSEMVPLDVVVTVAVKEKVPSPLSEKAWVWLPPIRRRSPVTEMLVLGAGEVAGVTVTVRTEVWPAVTDAGFEEPVALREVEAGPELELCGLGAPEVKSASLLVLVGGVERLSESVALMTGAAEAPS